MLHFTHDVYQQHDAKRPFDEELNWSLGNESFKKDMERLIFKIARQDALVIVPVITQHQLDGLGQWFEALPGDKRPKLAVSLMFSPQWTPWRDRAIRGTEYYARAIERFRPWLGESVLLYTETPEASSYYEQLTGVRIAVLPIPVARPKRFARVQGDGRVRFGYLGHTRREKGFHLLPAAIDICQRQRFPFELIAHIHHDHNDPTVISADEALRSKRNVSTILGPLDLERHYRLLDFCDAILLPYDPAMYRARGSALFAEAIAYGKPMVVTAGTVMENSANRGECVAKVFKFNPADLAHAMGEVCSHFGEMEAQAKMTAQRWSETNSVSAFCRRILDFASKSNHPGHRLVEGGLDETESVPLWPTVRPGRAVQVFDLPLPIQASRRIEFIAQELHASKGLVVDVGLDSESGKVDPVIVRVELNGHVLPSFTVAGRRRTYHRRGPFPFLMDGLPTSAYN